MGKPFHALAAILLIATIASTARATILIYNTGVDGSGNVPGDGTPDGHYTFNVPGNPTPFVDAAISNSPAPDLTSAWITPLLSGPGTYPTTTTFTVPTVEPITITGQWAALAAGIGMSINGQNNGTFTTPVPGNSWTPFTITGTTVAGTNTLEFFPYTDGSSPVALRVEIDSVALPEPTSATLVCLAALAASTRRRRPL